MTTVIFKHFRTPIFIGILPKSDLAFDFLKWMSTGPQKLVIIKSGHKYSAVEPAKI